MRIDSRRERRGVSCKPLRQEQVPRGPVDVRHRRNLTARVYLFFGNFLTFDVDELLVAKCCRRRRWPIYLRKRWPRSPGAPSFATCAGGDASAGYDVELYNMLMRAEIERRFGRGALARSQAEAQHRWRRKQAVRTVTVDPSAQPDAR